MAEEDNALVKPARPRKPRAVPAVAPDTDTAHRSEADEVSAPRSSVKAVLPVEATIAINEAAPSPAVQSDAPIAPVEAAAVASKDIKEMATVPPTDTVDKAQAVFGDFSERFKTAFEKSTKLGEDMVEFAKGNVEAMIASARVAAKTGEALGQEAAEYGKKNFESATTAFKSFATVKSPTELFQLQSEFAKAQFD
ncbi:phasin family protein, partial [Sphingomonas sp.]|uniref:phasin family protein n=1 Tax=Sphingomonas sp. TaxID=28214 RepID=UPI003B3BE1E8